MPEKVLPRPFQHASAKVGLYFVRFPKQKDPVKRCPECRRDYYDDSLLYCLDDGTALLEGPASGNEPATAFLHETAKPSEAATKAQIHLTTPADGASSGIVAEVKTIDRRLILGSLLLIIILLGGFL